MTSLQVSSLEHTEDISSILSKLKDIDKRLIEIEDNTHPGRGNRSNFRHNRQEKVTVDITAMIISIDDIDTISQQFKCDFYLSATWQEPQLQGRSPSEEIKWHKEWHPRIEFFNAVEIKMEKYRDLRYEQEENAIVVESYRIKGTFRQNLNLRNFPLDYQELTITLKSTWTSKQVEFQKDLRKEDRIEPVTFTADQEWHLYKHVVTESTTQHIGHATGPNESSEHDYPLYLIKCHVKRKSGYYVWNFAMVIFLIYVLSFCSFSVEISSPADRLSITLTLLLTAIAFKFVISQSLPTISYMTLLDRYVLSGLVFLWLMAIENAAVAAFITDPNTQKRVDRICLHIALACALVLQVVALAFVIKKWRTRNEELAKSENVFLEMKDRVNKRAKERQKNQQKTHETSI